MPSGRTDGWSSTQPDFVLRERLAMAINDQMQLLASRQPETDFQVRVYLRVIEAIGPDPRRGRIGGMMPRSAAWIEEARMGLIRDIDREGIFAFYQQLIGA